MNGETLGGKQGGKVERTVNTAGDRALKKGSAIKTNEKKHNERGREMFQLG